MKKLANENVVCGRNTLGEKINEILDFYIQYCRDWSLLVHHTNFLANGEGNQKLYKKQSMYLFSKTNLCHLEK